MTLNWISEHLDGIDNPFISGNVLIGDKIGLWKYRVGVYRPIIRIDEGKPVTLLIKIGHRSDIQV